MALVTVMIVPGVVHAMPNDYRTPEPIESLKVFLPTTGQTWKDITVFVNVCDARFNPNCDYGNRRGAMDYVPYSIEIHEIDPITEELALVETVYSKTNRLGYDAEPIKLDEKYSDKTQYQITVATDDDVKTGKFWTHTRVH